MTWGVCRIPPHVGHRFTVCAALTLCRYQVPPAQWVPQVAHALDAKPPTTHQEMLQAVVQSRWFATQASDDEKIALERFLPTPAPDRALLFSPSAVFVPLCLGRPGMHQSASFAARCSVAAWCATACVCHRLGVFAHARCLGGVSLAVCAWCAAITRQKVPASTRRNAHAGVGGQQAVSAPAAISAELPASDEDLLNDEGLTEADLEDEVELIEPARSPPASAAPASVPAPAAAAAAAAEPEAAAVDYSAMTLPELKDELRQRGLRVSGKKAELVARIAEFDADNGAATASASASEDDAAMMEPAMVRCTIEDQLHLPYSLGAVTFHSCASGAARL